MRRYLVRCSVTLLYLFVIISCSKSNNGPPDWRMPTANELSSSWRSINPDKFSIVRGDFNGDGVIDEAKLLVRKDGTGIGLFAFVSENGKYKTFLLEEIKNKLQIDAIGIDKVTYGKYKTACGKGYWDCSKEETPEIELTTDSLNLFKYESANSFFYWNKQKKVFNRIWITD